MRKVKPGERDLLRVAQLVNRTQGSKPKSFDSGPIHNYFKTSTEELNKNKTKSLRKITDEFFRDVPLFSLNLLHHICPSSRR